MRILEIAPPLGWQGEPFPPQRYGAIERVVWELGEALKRLGVEVDYANEDVEIDDALTRGGFDFIHVHTPPQAAILRGRGVEYIATTHWHEHWNDTPDGAASREMVDLAWAHLALGENVISGRRCAVMGQGVNMDEITRRDGAEADVSEGKHILMVGTYKYAHAAWVNPVECKRYRYGIRWLALDEEATLTLAGPGEAQMIYDMCNDHGVDRERVSLPGNLKRPELVGAMHESTVLLHAAAQEVVALSPLEAMAAGLPVICARPCAGYYGDAVTVFDHWEHLPDALVDVQAHYTARAKAGYKFAKAHTWDHVAERALAILEEWRGERDETTQEKA